MALKNINLSFLAAFVLVFISVNVFSTDNKTFTPGYYWVSFTDKDNSPYDLANPEEFLSDESIQRRIKFGIGFNELDLPVTPSYITEISAFGTVLYSSKWFNAVLMKITSNENFAAVFNLTFFQYIEFMKPLDITKDERTNKEQLSQLESRNFFAELSHYMHNYGSYSLMQPFNDYGYMEDQIALLNGDKLNDEGFYGNGVLIALMDAGYTNVDELSAFTHLWDTGNIAGYLDLVDDYETVFDSHQHGTMVLSVMAANLPGQAKAAATEATYLLYRTEDAKTEYRIEECNWLKGVELADSAGAYIINSSLGYSVFDDDSQSYTYQDLDGLTTIAARAANIADDKGMLVFNSAGNYGNQSWMYIGTPADSFGAVAVGATDLSGELAGFSSIGPSADGRIKPELVAPGHNITVINSDGIISNASGTSFSSPILASVAACLWEAFPDRSNEDIKNAIINSADNYQSPDNYYGYGMPDFQLAKIILENEFSHTPNQLAFNNKLRIYPNPVNEFSYILMFADVAENVDIAIFDTRGQLVQDINSVDLFTGLNKIYPFEYFNRLSQGLYVIQISTKDEKYLVKAVKSN
ncbi:MAG: S8 family serine peptidase [Bacteroidales bacterium]